MNAESLLKEVVKLQRKHYGDATALHLAMSGWTERASTLIAELGQEVGAVEPVAFAVELADGSIGKLGWMDYGSFDLCNGVSELREGCRYVFAYRTSPAHTSEARDATFVERLAREYSLLRGWSLDDWNNPSIKNRADIIADMQMAYNAAMRQEAE